MAKVREQEAPTSITETSVVPATPQTLSLNDLFRREVNSRPPLKSVRIGRTLTRPLVSMAHEKDPVFVTFDGEMYTMQLASNGRKASYPARVADGYRRYDDGTGEEIVLVLNEMMVGAIKKAGYQIIEFGAIDDAGKFDTKTLTGTPLKGHSFVFRAGDIKTDKKYRVVETIEAITE